MSYTPNEWQKGDIITAAKLNNMEDGIQIADPFVITLTPTEADLSGTMDKTPAEITAQISTGRRISFYIPALGGTIECTQFLADQVTGLATAHANIVFNPGTGDALMHIATSLTGQTYSVYVFPLT